MKLIETDGKKMLSEAGIPVPSSVFIPFGVGVLPDDVQYPLYVKAQVLQGHRGQQGFVRQCLNDQQTRQALVDMTASFGGIPCAGFRLETEILHDEEWFVSFDIDRAEGCIRLNVSAAGGVNVSTVQSCFVTSSEDIRCLNVPEQLHTVLQYLYGVFVQQDVLQLEINPLVRVGDGSYLALDAKIEIDDAASARHPEWSAYTVLSETGRVLSERELSYAQLLLEGGYRGTLGRLIELDGDIAVILSGGGASLVALDALKKAGGKPANYVEMSGNPDPEYVRRAARIVLSKPGLRAIWIAGSYANFTDINVTVSAVLAAIGDLDLCVPIVIRRDGPHAAEAKQAALQWAVERGVSLQFDRADTDLETSAQAVVIASRL